MKNFQENIIPAEKQNVQNVYVHGNTGIRILFAGNSITKHAPKPIVGWTNDCGMAASDIDHDYVHLLLKKIREVDPHAGYCIAQVADVERQYDRSVVLEGYVEAAQFNADIVIMFFGANVPKDKCDPYPEQVAIWEDTYQKARNLFSNNGRAKVFHSEGFYIRPMLNAAKKRVADACVDTYISLGDIPHREDTHGIYNHPSDKGMEEIANCFWDAIRDTVLRFIIIKIVHRNKVRWMYRGQKSEPGGTGKMGSNRFGRE